MNPSDAELLRTYVAQSANASLAALVERHVNLVYSVARRHVSSSQLAEDVTQSVFIELARNARKISPGTPIVAWLHVVSRRTALNAARGETRRHLREQAAAEIAAMKSTPPSWDEVSPLLDEAVESLSETDRAAVLLRFFENKKLRDVGLALGLSDDAAQKRVTRALEELRAFFRRRGMVVSSASLASELATHGIGPVPAALGSLITAAATSAVPSATFSTTTILALTTSQKIGVAAAIVAGAFTTYEGLAIFRQRAELDAARDRHAQLTSEITALRARKKTTADRLAAVNTQLSGRLAASAAPAPEDAALESRMNTWLAQLDRLKNFLVGNPQLSIPELQLLSQESWFAIVANGTLEGEEDYRRASARLRQLAEGFFVGKISRALYAYTRANDDRLPEDPRELAPYFNPPVDPAMLARYEMLQHGKASEVPQNQRMKMIAVKTPVDLEYDVFHWAGTGGHGNNGSLLGFSLAQAQSAFRRDHPGEDPANASRLVPYFKWPVDVAVLQRYIDRQQPGFIP